MQHGEEVDLISICCVSKSMYSLLVFINGIFVFYYFNNDSKSVYVYKEKRNIQSKVMNIQRYFIYISSVSYSEILANCMCICSRQRSYHQIGKQREIQRADSLLLKFGLASTTFVTQELFLYSISTRFIQLHNTITLRTNPLSHGDMEKILTAFKPC